MPGEKIDLYKPLYPIFSFGLRRKYDVSIEGAENIPETPALYTPNHIRFADSALVAMAYTQHTGIPLRFGAKREYFEGRGIDNEGKHGRSMKFLMEHTRMIPVDREEVDLDALQLDATSALERGESVALHPEGTRSDNGKIHRFRPGAAMIAIANSVPLVPTGVVYTEYSNRKKTHVDLIFGEPLHPDDFNAPERTERRKILALTQAAEASVAGLTGMEQSGVTAKIRKLRQLGETDRK